MLELLEQSEISIVVPVFNEEEVIEQLYLKISKALNTLEDDFEVIFVNDGSTDHTLDKLLKIRNGDKRYKVLSLSRNFGYQAALTAGIKYAKGDYVLIMDGDLQDPPELIPEMYTKIKTEALDVVLGKRIKRNENFIKRLLTSLFHWIFKRLSNIKAPADTGNYSILNRKAVDALIQLSEKNRYLPGLRHFVGFKQGFIEYERPDRGTGTAKMSFSKLSKLAFDAIFSFSNIPIKLAWIIGGIGIMLSIAGTAVVVYKKIIGDAITGWTSTMLSLYFFGSVQLFFLGVLGEYVYRIYKETQNRPIYIVDEFYD